MNHSNGSHWTEIAHSLGEEFASRAEAHDEGDAFVSRNYTALKEQRVFSAAIPEDFGGGEPHTATSATCYAYWPDTAAPRPWRFRCISISSLPRFGSIVAARVARPC